MMFSVARWVVVFFILVLVAVIVFVAIKFSSLSGKHPLDAVNCQGLVQAGVLAAGVDTSATQNVNDFCVLGSHWVVDGGISEAIAAILIPTAITDDECRTACLDPTLPCQSFSFDSSNKCVLTVSGADPKVLYSTALLDAASAVTTALRLKVPFVEPPTQCTRLINDGDINDAAPFLQQGPSNICGVIGFGPSGSDFSGTAILSKANLNSLGCAELCSEDARCDFSSLSNTALCTTYQFGAQGPVYSLDKGRSGNSVFYKVPSA